MAQTGAIFLWEDLARSSTVTASTTAAGLAASNVIVDHRQVFHRTTVDTASWWQFTHTASVAPTAIAIIDHNITSGNTQLRVRDSTTSNFSGGTQATLANLTWNDKIIYGSWAAGTARLYHRLEITDAANPSTYLQIGKILLGYQFTPVDSWEFGFQRGYQDLSQIQMAINGPRSGVVRPKPKTRQLAFPISSQAELENWEEFFETVGTTRGFVALLDQDNRPDGEALYCSFAGPIELPNIYGAAVNEARLALMEMV